MQVINYTSLVLVRRKKSGACEVRNCQRVTSRINNAREGVNLMQIYVLTAFGRGPYFAYYYVYAREKQQKSEVS